jgi:hypothetical protein
MELIADQLLRHTFLPVASRLARPKLRIQRMVNTPIVFWTDTSILSLSCRKVPYLAR